MAARACFFFIVGSGFHLDFIPKVMILELYLTVLNCLTIVYHIRIYYGPKQQYSAAEGPAPCLLTVTPSLNK